MKTVHIQKINETDQTRSGTTRDLDWWLGLAAIVCIIAAGIFGYTQSTNAIEPALHKAVPSATRFERLDDVTFAAYDGQDAETFRCYVSLGTANGYGGPLVLAVATDLKGSITGVGVVDHKETPNWFKRVAASGFTETLLGKSYTDAFSFGEDLAAVAGATYTSRALAKAALQGSRTIAKSQLNLSVPPEPVERIQFGVPEIVLIVLFAVGFIGHRRSFKFTKQARWFSMVVGMIVLGFWYTEPLTISHINKLLLGFWPEWQTHIYYYLLVTGIFLVLTIDNKNPYCMWFCPFGAAQECMGLVGGAKQAKNIPYKSGFKWAQRGLAFMAIIIALLFRNPGLSGYEIFGTLFDLDGSIFLFFLLGLVLVTAMFIRRPWCNYLCPIPPIEGFIKMLRRRVKKVWLKRTQKNA
ncbi:FMN-binding protein [Pseudodesulfovibrio sp. JC047]|uniref:FMN-binding protein n=1 Tax=Pseudodesulfovibrio sp. JC047 TaxID=2683199 RepID=UPI0013D84172